MAEIKWIKLATDIFENRKIKQIEKMPEGDSIIVIWLKILCLAGTINDSGLIYLTREVPYTDDMLAAQFDRPLSTVRLALATFEKFGMIEIVDDFLLLPSWEKYQNLETLEKIREQTRQRVAAYREKQKQKLPCNVTGNVTVTLRNATEEERDIDNNICSSFDAFWANYPRKVAKQAALKAYTKLAPNEDLFNTMLTALARQIESEEWQRDNGRYIPYPATWLNGRRWEDEADEEQPSQKKHKLIERDGQLYAVEVDDDT